jgi:nitroreductase/NAD-dependent dihydropyrimidine dehydrogenase PreA subunit
MKQKEIQMIDFIVNEQNCIKCGKCAADCPARIISMEESFPFITQENEASCYKCQHCLSICPTASISILGLDPKNSLPLTGNLPDSTQMELLIRGRRAVRHYKPENVEPDVLKNLLKVSSHAPTGRNSHQVRFTVVENRAKLTEIRDEMMAKLVAISNGPGFPEGMEFFSNYVKMWEESATDFIFRGAPHFIVASAPKTVATPHEDCVISLTTFEMYAQTLGIGTVWDGLAKYVINDLFPEFKTRLGIPEDHVVGYAMAFGLPAVQYARTAQHEPAGVHFVN